MRPAGGPGNALAQGSPRKSGAGGARAAGEFSGPKRGPFGAHGLMKSIS